MKKIKSWWALLAGQILSLLGFQSCDILVPKCMYGCPNVDYTIKGTVTDESGKPIEGIRVAIHRSPPPREGVIYDEPVFAKDTLFTDKEGKVGYSRNDFEAGIATVYLEDIDGPENGGEFSPLTVKDIKANQVKKGDGDWYNGAFEAEFSAKMKKK